MSDQTKTELQGRLREENMNVPELPVLLEVGAAVEWFAEHPEAIRRPLAEEGCPRKYRCNPIPYLGLLAAAI